MKHTIRGRAGPASIQIECPAHYGESFQASFNNPNEASTHETPDLQLTIHDAAEQAAFKAEFSAGKNLAYRRGSFSFRGPNFLAIIDGLFDPKGTCSIDVFDNRKHDAKSQFNQFARSVVSSAKQRRIVAPSPTSQFVNSVMSYSLFWFVVHAVLLKKGASFIHASSLVVGGKTLLLAGTGGCGKTSTTFKLLEEPGASYLAEDFSILSSDGRLFYNPKAMSIYASDLRGSPKILLNYTQKHLTTAECSSWNRSIEGSGNPMKKVPPHLVLDAEQLRDVAQLDTALFLVRGDFKKIAYENIAASEFAERSMNASYRELKTLSEIIAQGNAVGAQQLDMPSIEEFRDRMRQAYCRATEATPCHLLQIPIGTDPSLLSAFIKHRWL